MKRRLVILLVISILLISPFVQAQTYSGFNRFTDNVKLFFSNGNNKVQLALEIREKEVNSAIENTENGNTEKAVKNLEKAQDKLKIVQEKISLKNSLEVKTSVQEVREKINKENLPEEFKEYKLEEEKTQLTAELTLKTYEYCKALAQEDYSLMLKDEECNPETAHESLKDDLAKLKDLQERMFVQLMLDIRSCIDDPGTCNCDEVLDVEEKAKCEKLVSLAIKCEYKNDETSCNELESMKPKKGDSFADSFIPDFLMNLFKEKDYMIDYNINHSDGVPEECWDKNDKPECEQYANLKETKDDWDEYGNYIGKRPKNKEPTMRESIPQCFDENDNFLKEKCGEIKVVRNEEGLVNYIIEKEIDNIIDKLENSSVQNKIDANGTEGRTMVNEIKQEMNQIKEEIAERTFAPGTSDAGNSTNDVKNVVVEGGKGSGDGGLKPEVKTDVAGGSIGGESGVVIEGGKNNVVSGGHDKNNPLPEPNLNQINPDIAPTGRAPGDTIDETYDDGEITNTIDP